VAKYYGPAGKAVQDTSVVPNVLVTDSEPTGDEEEETPAPSSPAKSGEDPILKKGLEVLTGNVKVEAAGSAGAQPNQVKPAPQVLTPLNIPKKK
jgi:hypothetical protein